MPSYEYTLTLAAGNVTLNTNTRIPVERGAAAVIRWFRYFGAKGKDGIKVGEDGRVFEIEGWLHSDSEANLETAKATLMTAAKNAEVGSLSYRGVTTPVGNVVLAGPPEFSEHYYESSTVVGCMYRLVLDQIVPD